MFALEIYKIYLSGNEETGGYFRWICRKIKIDKFSNYELSCPFYRNRRDVILGVKHFSGYNHGNLNPFATELFEQRVCGNCIIHFEKLNEKEFDIWCDIIKKDLQNMGAKNESFEY
jgi:hypothetical protein